MHMIRVACTVLFCTVLYSLVLHCTMLILHFSFPSCGGVTLTAVSIGAWDIPRGIVEY